MESEFTDRYLRGLKGLAPKPLTLAEFVRARTIAGLYWPDWRACRLILYLYLYLYLYL